MQKKRALFLLALIFCGFLLYIWNRADESRADVLRTVCWSIAKDLLTNTNSERVALVNSWSGTNFSAFLAGSANIQDVKLGDKPKDFFSFQEHAAARLCFTNQKNKHFEIRIRHVNSATNFDVIGVMCD